MDELKNKSRQLSIFLKSKIQVQITMKDKVLVIAANGNAVSPKDVKTYVKRFLYHRDLSETYKVTEERGVVRIIKRKRRRDRRTKNRVIRPSSYDTLPYYFPAHP